MRITVTLAARLDAGMDNDTPVDVLRPETFLHLIIPFEELTQAQKDEAFVHHAMTGGDILFLKNGEVIYG